MSEPREAQKGDRFSPREIEVAGFLAAGHENKIIAYELGICDATVKALVSSILRKCGASNRTKAALIIRGFDLKAETELARAGRRAVSQ